MVSETRYDILLGSPSYVANDPHTDYVERGLKENRDVLNFQSPKEYRKNSPVMMTNLSVKRLFRFLESSQQRAS